MAPCKIQNGIGMHLSKLQAVKPQLKELLPLYYQYEKTKKSSIIGGTQYSIIDM